jgi:hypothetical protein
MRMLQGRPSALAQRRSAVTAGASPCTEFTRNLHPSESADAIRAYAAAVFAPGPPDDKGWVRRQLRDIQDFVSRNPAPVSAIAPEGNSSV